MHHAHGAGLLSKLGPSPGDPEPGRRPEAKWTPLELLMRLRREEIMQQLDYVRRWGGKFIVPIPEARIYS